ncbi:MAG TPA: type II toxin-antitoxin system RelE/ParE family toxin [Streptosporangiaceae bacterium]
MVYEIVFRDDARKTFQQLDRAVQRRLERAMERLAENPRPGQATQLVSDSQTWRVRAGDWRVLYEIHDDQHLVLVLDVRHRSTAYRDR